MATYITGKVLSESECTYVMGSFDLTSRKLMLTRLLNLIRAMLYPPFGEAHNHNLQSAFGIEETVTNYLRAGIFYVKITQSKRGWHP